MGVVGTGEVGVVTGIGVGDIVTGGEVSGADGSGTVGITGGADNTGGPGSTTGTSMSGGSGSSES